MGSHWHLGSLRKIGTLGHSSWDIYLTKIVKKIRLLETKIFMCKPIAWADSELCEEGCKVKICSIRKQL